MRFHRELLLNTAEECDWVRNTHLKAFTPPSFGAVTVAGNEDSPVRLDLYKSARPEYNERPIAVYEMNSETGDLVLKVTQK